MRGWAVLLLALVPGAALLEPAAAGARTTVQLARGAPLDSGWTSFTFTTDGDWVGANAVIHRPGGAVQAGVAFLDAAGVAISTVIISWGGTRQGVWFSASPKDWQVAAFGSLESSTSTTDYSVGGSLNEANGQYRGTFHVLLWWAGTAEGFRWSVSRDAAQAGPSILASAAGSHAFVYDSRSMPGVAGAQAQTGGAGVRATLGGDVTVAVTDTPMMLAYGPLGADFLRLETPRGTLDCPCTVNDFRAPAPGRYTLRDSGVGVGDNGEVLFGGADAYLP